MHVVQPSRGALQVGYQIQGTDVISHVLLLYVGSGPITRYTSLSMSTFCRVNIYVHCLPAAFCLDVQVHKSELINTTWRYARTRKQGDREVDWFWSTRELASYHSLGADRSTTGQSQEMHRLTQYDETIRGHANYGHMHVSCLLISICRSCTVDYKGAIVQMQHFMSPPLPCLIC